MAEQRAVRGRQAVFCIFSFCVLQGLSIVVQACFISDYHERALQYACGMPIADALVEQFEEFDFELDDAIV